MSNIEPNFVPFEEEKIKCLKKSKHKLHKIIKREQTTNHLKYEIKEQLLNEIKNMKNNYFQDYKPILLFILFFAEKFEDVKVKIQNRDLDTSKLKTDSFWKNPSKELLIFFLYTYFFEKYNEYLTVHLEYMSNKNADEIIKELNRF